MESLASNFSKIESNCINLYFYPEHIQHYNKFMNLMKNVFIESFVNISTNEWSLVI